MSVSTIPRLARHAAAVAAWAIGTWAAAGPVTGTTGPGPDPARPQARPHAAAAEDFDFCRSEHLKTGWLIGLSMVTLATPPTEQTFTIASTAAGATSHADIVSYMDYDNVLESATAHSGSLRWSMWAFPQNHVVGWPRMNGHRLGGFTPQILDGQGVTRNYLYNLTKLTFRQRVTTTNPPPGRYCIAFVIEMYRTDSECRAVSADGYCPEVIYTLTPAITFR